MNNVSPSLRSVSRRLADAVESLLCAPVQGPEYWQEVEDALTAFDEADQRNKSE